MNTKEEPKQDETEYLLSIKTNKNRLLEDVQQEQDKKMYSEEEVLDILFTMSVDNPNNITKWFEQFKNK